MQRIATAVGLVWINRAKIHFWKKKKQAMRSLFRNEDSLPQGCSRGWGSSAPTPCWLKEKNFKYERGRRTKETNLKATNERQESWGSTFCSKLTLEVVEMYKQSRDFFLSSFSFANSWGKEIQNLPGQKLQTHKDKNKTSIGRESLLEYILLCMHACSSPLPSSAKPNLFEERKTT